MHRPAQQIEQSAANVALLVSIGAAIAAQSRDLGIKEIIDAGKREGCVERAYYIIACIDMITPSEPA